MQTGRNSADEVFTLQHQSSETIFLTICARPPTDSFGGASSTPTTSEHLGRGVYQTELNQTEETDLGVHRIRATLERPCSWFRRRRPSRRCFRGTGGRRWVVPGGRVELVVWCPSHTARCTVPSRPTDQPARSPPLNRHRHRTVQLKVSKMTIFKIYLLRYFSTNQKKFQRFLILDQNI